MKHCALFIKEIRECLPLLAVSALLLLGFAYLELMPFLRGTIPPEYRHYTLESGRIAGVHHLSSTSPFSNTGVWLLMLSIGLGIALGVRQFGMPGLSRTWAFLIHRSVRRRSLLTVKIVTALLGICLCLGGIWTLIFSYGAYHRDMAYPPYTRTLIEGWAFVAIGFVVYLATAQTALASTRWYTTRLIHVGLACLICFSAFMETHLLMAFGLVLTGGVVLLIQLVHTYIHKEF